MVIFLPSFSPRFGVSRVALPLFVCKVSLAPAKLTAPPSSLFWFPPYSASLPSSPLNQTSLLPRRPRPSVTSFGMLHLKPRQHMLVSWPTTFLNGLPLMFYLLTAPNCFKLILHSCASSSHGSVLRDLCRDYPQMRTFPEACRE